mgnify:FL=1
MKKALIVIDIQEGLINLEPFSKDQFIDNTKKVINYFRNKQYEVIYFRHSEREGLLATESSNWHIYHELKPFKEERIFNKFSNSIFKETGLNEYLESKDIDSLTFIGMQAEFCVDVSTKIAYELGYKVELVRDAITTFDNKFFTAEQILTFYDECIWNDRFAKVKNTDDIIKRW